MKIKNIIILAVVIFSLSQCNKKEASPSYSNESITTDNVLAAMYFHIIFCEAENAWAFIDDMDYVANKTYTDPASTSTVFKKMTYDDDTEIITIEYQAWVTNNYDLTGTITVRIVKNSYRVEGKVANVYLRGFSINEQNVVGESSLKYREEKNNDNDIYTYTLLNGSAIHEQGTSMPVLISGSVVNGRYERIEGGETLSLDDDVWAYFSTMTGMVREVPSLKYTNTVLDTVQYSMNCKIARQGVSQIKIQGRSNIFYECLCLVNYNLSITDDFNK